MNLIRPRSIRRPVVREDGLIGGFTVEHWDDHVDATVTNPKTLTLQSKMRMIVPDSEQQIIRAANRELKR